MKKANIHLIFIMKGQTLLEALLALSVLILIISGIAATTVSSLNNANFGKTQSVATQYAQEGIEILRRIRNSNFAAFRNYTGNYCLAKGSNDLQPYTSCSSPNVDTYIRAVNIAQSGCGPNVAKAIVNVSWTDNKCTGGAFCHTSKLISCFSTINPMQGFSTINTSNPQSPVPTSVVNSPIPTSPSANTSVILTVSPCS